MKTGGFGVGFGVPAAGVGGVGGVGVAAGADGSVVLGALLSAGLLRGAVGVSDVVAVPSKDVGPEVTAAAVVAVGANETGATGVGVLRSVGDASGAAGAPLGEKDGAIDGAADRGDEGGGVSFDATCSFKRTAPASSSFSKSCTAALSKPIASYSITILRRARRRCVAPSESFARTDRPPAHSITQYPGRVASAYGGWQPFAPSLAARSLMMFCSSDSPSSLRSPSSSIVPLAS